MFVDRITVESPGILPGIVRLNNLRTVHFSRNPKIAEFLHQYEYVKEFGEGIDRMFTEMEAAGLPEPEYANLAFMLNATIRNININSNNEKVNENINENINLTQNEQLVCEYLSKNPYAKRTQLISDLSITRSTLDRIIKSLKEKNILEHMGARKNGYWKIL